MAEKWQILKNGVPVMVCNSVEEAEDNYCKYDCDDMRKIPESEDDCQVLRSFKKF